METIASVTAVSAVLLQPTQRAKPTSKGLRTLRARKIDDFPFYWVCPPSHGFEQQLHWIQYSQSYTGSEAASTVGK